ncbi:MAG: Lreu_0056 family protein [Catenisphaera adipataccumulans]|uniref:Lreu_0056 family protein n=1 Tax=Catenisphaera adipataccumulans TaxID=700500 RepID=UPI003D8B079C
MVAYNSIQAKNQAKTKTASKAASASKKSKSSNQSTNSRKSSSAASSNNSASSRQSTPELNDRQVGTLLSLYYWPDYFKGLIGDSGIYYGDDQQDGETYHYFTGNGDPTSVLYYQIDGDTITYRYVDVSNADCVADAPIATKTISLKRLVNDYYNTSAKRAEVNGYVAKLKPLSEIRSE